MNRKQHQTAREEESHLTINSPVGKLHITASPKGVRVLSFAKRSTSRGHTSSQATRGSTSAKVLKETKQQLTRYFSGDVRALEKIEVDPAGTPFQRKVWKALRQIKPGTTLTYGEVAKKVGHPKAPRAVGGALNRNPVCLVLPCHRVIGKDGSLTGFGGGIKRKEFLLKHEGALH